MSRFTMPAGPDADGNPIQEHGFGIVMRIAVIIKSRHNLDLIPVISTAATLTSTISAAATAAALAIIRPPAGAALNKGSVRASDRLGPPAAALLFDYVKLDLLPVAETLESVGVNRRVVSEAVAASIVGNNETESLLGICGY